MSLFGALVKLAVTPVAIVKDVVSLGGAIDNNGNSHTLEHLEEVVDESNK